MIIAVLPTLLFPRTMRSNDSGLGVMVELKFENRRSSSASSEKASVAHDREAQKLSCSLNPSGSLASASRGTSSCVFNQTLNFNRNSEILQQQS